MIMDAPDAFAPSYRDLYAENGYVIVPGLIPAHHIDRILYLYEKDIRTSRRKFFRQNTSKYEKNRFTPQGHVVQSYLDIHNYRQYPQFRRAALDLYFCQDMTDALSSVTGYSSHNLMQSMLFEANSPTPPHQDWWYSDSVPQGNLVGSWIALEDIHEDAGRFFVLTGTQRVELHDDNLPHSAWIARMRQFMDTHQELIRVPALRKGDVLFWNSGLIHGALAGKNDQHSRRSLTAHFMPSSMTFGNLFTTKPWVQYEQYGNHKMFANQPEYSYTAAFISKVKMLVYNNPLMMRLLRKLQRRSVADMAVFSRSQAAHTPDVVSRP
jgi:phytanoyl-CoA hydroxylase